MKHVNANESSMIFYDSLHSTIDGANSYFVTQIL